MTDNELLLAISNMMDKKLDARLTPIENRFDRIENRITELEKKMDSKIAILDNKITALEEKMDSKIAILDNKITNIALTIENEIQPQLNTLSFCYTDTYDRYKDYADRMEDAFNDIGLLKKVASEHSIKLQSIS